MRLAPISTLLLLACAANSGFATLEFSAYLRSESESRFLLTDVEAAQSSGWLTLGQAFRGYALVGFDRKTDTLTVRKEGATLALPLKTSRTNGEIAQAAEIARQLAEAKNRLATLRKRYRDAYPGIQAELKKIAELEQANGK